MKWKGPVSLGYPILQQWLSLSVSLPIFTPERVFQSQNSNYAIVMFYQQNTRTLTKSNPSQKRERLQFEEYIHSVDTKEKNWGVLDNGNGAKRLTKITSLN